MEHFRSFLWSPSVILSFDVLKLNNMNIDFHLNWVHVHFFFTKKSRKVTNTNRCFRSSFLKRKIWFHSDHTKKQTLKISVPLSKVLQIWNRQSVTRANHIKLHGNKAINMSYKNFDTFYNVVGLTFGWTFGKKCKLYLTEP